MKTIYNDFKKVIIQIFKNYTHNITCDQLTIIG